MRLENWFVQGNTAFGEVYGNHKFADGEFVRTSQIQSIVDGVLTTRNSVYELGEPANIEENK